MSKWIIGILLLLIGSTGIGLSVVGIVIGRRAIEEMGANLANTLAITITGLSTVEGTLQLTKNTLNDFSQGLDTTQQIMVHASQSVSQTVPLVDQANQVVNLAPDTLSSVQRTISNIAAVTKAIDTTLIKLSKFKLNQNIMGFPLVFDLGIAYNSPDPQIDQSLTQVESNLGNLSKNLSHLDGDLKANSQNLSLISQDLQATAQNLGRVKGDMAKFSPMLDNYILIVSQLKDNLSQAQADLSRQLEMVKLVLTVVMIWVGLISLTPLYLSWTLLIERQIPGA
jgi:hypothetical protein